MGTFDILNNSIEHVALVQNIDLLGNMDHEVSVVGKWILIQNKKHCCRQLLNH